MGDFIRGWRRKVGCVTLLMALLFMVGWIRSQFRFEYVDFPIGNVAYGVTSMHGGLDFSRMTALDQTAVWKTIGYDSVELFIKPQDPFNETPWNADFEFEWRWDWARFHIGEGRYANRRDQDCMIPYWSIVLPLTFLSAYLFLRPHKARTREKVRIQ